MDFKKCLPRPFPAAWEFAGRKVGQASDNLAVRAPDVRYRQHRKSVCVASSAWASDSLPFQGAAGASQFPCGTARVTS